MLNHLYNGMLNRLFPFDAEIECFL
jgi:hypothetical protein